MSNRKKEIIKNLIMIPVVGLGYIVLVSVGIATFWKIFEFTMKVFGNV